MTGELITIGSLPTALEVRRAADIRRAQRDHTLLQTCLRLLIAAFEQDDVWGVDLPYPVPEELADAPRARGFESVKAVGTRFIEPGKPWQNGYAESFHSRLREECLSLEVVYSARHAQVVLDGDWAFFNGRRPHSSLGYRTPHEYVEQARGRSDLPLVKAGTADEVPCS